MSTKTNRFKPITKSGWRRRARSVIESAVDTILEEEPDVDLDELEKRIRQDHYPFTIRDYHPYTMWLKEVRLEFPKDKSQIKTPDNIKYFWTGGNNE